MTSFTDHCGDLHIDGAWYTKLNCGHCGVTFFAPLEWVTRRRDHGEHGREFSCPNGHVRVWRESVLDKTRRERDRLQQQMARAEDERREAEAERDRAVAARKRIEKRVGSGVCPCCSRSFANLRSHMADQHPEMTPRRLSTRKRPITKRLALPAPSP